jgi:predicted nucleic acid-binding protein
MGREPAATMERVTDGRIDVSHLGRLMHQTSRALIEDAMIAAIAIQYDLTIATRNAKNFEDFGLKLLDPFKAR